MSNSHIEVIFSRYLAPVAIYGKKDDMLQKRTITRVVGLAIGLILGAISLFAVSFVYGSGVLRAIAWSVAGCILIVVIGWLYDRHCYNRHRGG